MIKVPLPTEENPWDIRPYPPMSNRGTFYILGAMVALGTLVSVGFTMMGAWPVLFHVAVPVAIFVGIFLYCRKRQNNHGERIYFNQQEDMVIEVYNANSEMVRQTVLHPVWVTLYWEEQNTQFSPHIQMRADGKRYKIAPFLSEKAGRNLMRRLKLAINEMNKSPQIRESFIEVDETKEAEMTELERIFRI